MIKAIKRIFLETDQGKIKLSQKASIFSFCLLLSTFFWFLSTLSKEFTTDLSFPVEYEGFSNNFILTDSPTNSLEGQVFGSGYELLGEQMSLNRKALQIDLKTARPLGKNGIYYIETKRLREEIDDKLDQDLQLQFLKPDTLYFKTQKRVSKTVKIIAPINLDFDAGYQLRGEVILSPKKVKISGPKSYIDTVQVLYTESKKVNDIDDSVSLVLNLIIPKEINGVHLDKEKVDVLIPTEKFTEKELELELNVKTSSSKISLKTFPSKVSVKVLLPISLYENFDESLLKAYVFFNMNQDKNRNKLDVEINGLPQYAKLIRVEPEKVEYILRK